jgi:hypothetical protein
MCDAAGAEGLTWEERRAVLVGKLREMGRADVEAAEEKERQKREAAAAINVGLLVACVGWFGWDQPEWDWSVHMQQSAVLCFSAPRVCRF